MVAELAFVGLLADVGVGGAVLEQEVDVAGDLVRSGGDRLGGAEVGFLTTEESAEGTVAVVEAACGESQGRGRAIGTGLGTASEDLAAGDVVRRAKGKPGGEMLDRRPGGHVAANLGEEGDSGIFFNALDRGQIGPGGAEEVAAQLDGPGL